jgi:hypothetical protein
METADMKDRKHNEDDREKLRNTCSNTLINNMERREMARTFKKTA